MKKPKVCYLWFEFISGSAGGAITHMDGLLSGLKSADCEVFIISPKEFDFLKEYKNTYCLGWDTKASFILNANFLKYAEMKKIIEKEKPDFIYQRHVAFTDAGARLAKDLNIPFILEYNGPLTWAIKNWAKNILFRILAYVFSPLFEHYERRTLSRANIITVISRPLEKILEENRIPKSKIRFNPNGVDTEKFSPKINGDKIRAKYKIPATAIVIGFIGTFGRWHGAEVLAKAAKELVSERNNIYFLFMGDGEYRKSAEKIAGNNERSIFTGAVQKDDVPVHLAACDILVNPTVPNPDGTEFFGSPTKLFEYMAMRKAIISSNLGQMKEFLENNKNSLLVEAGNHLALKDSIIMLADDKKTRGVLGKNARDTVAKEYTWKRNAERVLEAYNKLQMHT